jgi:hypothetical protein
MMAGTQNRTVGVSFWVDFEVEDVSGEPEAILRAGPKIHELEEKLNRLGYTFKLDQVRVRRPTTARKASEREMARRQNGGRDGVE